MMNRLKLPIALSAVILLAAWAASGSAIAKDLIVSAPVVPKSIKAGSRYSVTINIRKQDGVKISKVSWYWNSEGPFAYSHTSRENKVRARLFTGNPGTYKLSAKVCYSKRGSRSKCVRTPKSKITVR